MTGQLQECPVCAGTGYLSIVRGRNGATRPMPALHTAPRDLPHVIAEAFRETLEPVTGERRAEIAQVVEDVRLGYARLEEWPPLSVLGNLAIELGLPAFPLDRGKPTGRLAYEADFGIEPAYTKHGLRACRRQFRAACAPGYAPGEVHTPLDYALRPDSLARRWFSDAEIALALDALATAQADDGGWSFNWRDWNPATTIEWRGLVTVRALTILRAYGRLN